MMGRVNLYVWRHGSLGVDDHYDTVEDAVRSAVGIADHADGSPHGVEADGKWITPKDDEWRQIESAIHTEQRREWSEQPPMTHVVEVQAPDGEWAQYYGFPDFNEALAAAKEFRKARVRTTGPLSRRKTLWSTEGEQVEQGGPR